MAQHETTTVELSGVESTPRRSLTPIGAMVTNHLGLEGGLPPDAKISIRGDYLEVMLEEAYSAGERAESDRRPGLLEELLEIKGLMRAMLVQNQRHADRKRDDDDVILQVLNGISEHALRGADAAVSTARTMDERQGDKAD